MMVLLVLLLLTVLVRLLLLIDGVAHVGAVTAVFIAAGVAGVGAADNEYVVTAFIIGAAAVVLAVVV